MSAIFDVIRIPFGFIIKWLYQLTDNYLVAILVFSILLKLIMFPFGIKQQKNSQKQAKLRPKENVIRKKYAGRNDRATQMKMNTEIQELYQKENFSPFGGCLPMMVSMLVLLAVYAVVRSPLTYTASLPKTDGFDTVESIKQTVTYMVYQDDMALPEGEGREMNKFLTVGNSKQYTDEDFWKAYNAGKFTFYAEINSISYIRDHEEAFIQQYNSMAHYDENGKKVFVGDGLDASLISGQAITEALPKLEVFNGFDLGIVPSLDLFKAEKFGTKILLLIPIVNLIVAYFGQALTRKFTYQPEQTAEMKNQARIMNVFMPLFSMYIAFQVPSAVGIYWIMSSVLGPIQQIVLSKTFPIPEISPEEMREAERLYGGKQKKRKTPLTNGTKKKKSLIYDDDDEYETVSISTSNEKKKLTEKKESENTGIVEKAPLKDDD